MSNTQISIVTEKHIAPYIEPKMQKIINMIGEDNLTRETSFALQAVNSNSYLAQATPSSVAKCVMNVAFTGLSLNPVLKYAYITPRRVNNAVEAVLMPSYIGLCKLIIDAGAVRNIYAYLVHDGDEFEPVFGTELGLIHKPKFGKNVTHVYAVAVLMDGSKQFEVMTVEDVNEIRERSDCYKSYKDGKARSCIWVSDYGEMAKKTVIKRLTKYLPKTDKWEVVAKAIEVDNQDYPATDGQYTYIERLLDNSNYDQPRRDDVMRKIVNGMTLSDAETIINHLQQHQLDAIASGQNYSQTDIKRKIANEVK
jgi:phage RecT family recombinase